MKNNEDIAVVKGGIGFFLFLFVAFLILKLTNIVVWSWWLVASPLWFPFAVAGGILALLIYVCVLAFLWAIVKTILRI